MDVRPAFRDLLASFNEYPVDYMIVKSKGDSPRIRNSNNGEFWVFSFFCRSFYEFH